MSTRSLIGKLNDDGTVRYIYCHWDGYPSNNGRILKEAYNTPEKIDALLDLGDLSVLERELGERHDFDSHTDLHPTWCLSYGRDRNEFGVTSETVDSEAVYWGLEGMAYDYLFKNGKWYFRERGRKPKALTAKDIKG